MFNLKRCLFSLLYFVLLLVFVFTSFNVFAEVTYPREQTLIVDLFFGRVSNANNFNAWVTWVSPDRGLQNLVVNPLWMADPDLGRIENVLAEKAPEYNEDFTEMVAELRKGVYWNDGIEFTADDLVYTVELIMATPGMYYHSEFNMYVKEVYKTDDYTVVFKLKEPHSRFHDLFLDRWGACRPIPKHIWEKVEDPLKFQFNPPVGTGAYVLADYDPAGYWFIYEKREDWDRSVVGILSGEPKPKYVKFITYGEETTKAIAVIRNEMDICNLSPEATRAVLKMSDNVRGFYGKIAQPTTTSTCTTGASFNTEIFPYNIKDVRWALNLAVDVIEASMMAFDGFLALSPAFIPSSIPHNEWFYKDLQPWLKEFTISVEGEEFEVYDTDIPLKLAKLVGERGYKIPEKEEELREIFGYGWWRYSPELAEKLLNKHGFKKDDNGMWLLPNGEPWKILVTGGTEPVSPEYEWAFALAEQWRQFGINAITQPIERRTLMIQNGDFEIDMMWPVREAWGSHADLFRSFNPYHSDFYTPLGERVIGHVSRWTDKRLDEIIDKMKLIATDDPKTRELSIEAAKVTVEGMPGISIASFPSWPMWNTYYWRNYPGVENMYVYCGFTWSTFQFLLPHLESTNR